MDYPISGQKTVTKIFTEIKAKAAGIKGGKKASIAEYNKAIAKVEAIIERIEEEKRENHKRNEKISFKTGIKVLTSMLVKSIPALVLINTGTYISFGHTITGGPSIVSGIVAAFTSSAAITNAVIRGSMSAAFYDDMLDKAKDYCEDIIKDLEKAKRKVANE